MDFWAQWVMLEVVMHNVLAEMAFALAAAAVVTVYVRELAVVVAAGVVEGEFLESFQGEAEMAFALAEVVVVRAHVRELVVAEGVVEGEFLVSFQGEAGCGDESLREAEGVM